MSNPNRRKDNLTDLMEVLVEDSEDTQPTEGNEDTTDNSNSQVYDDEGRLITLELEKKRIQKKIEILRKMRDFLKKSNKKTPSK